MGFPEIRIKAFFISGKVPEAVSSEALHGFSGREAQDIPTIWVKSAVIVRLSLHLEISSISNCFLRSVRRMVNGQGALLRPVRFFSALIDAEDFPGFPVYHAMGRLESLREIADSRTGFRQIVPYDAIGKRRSIVRLVHNSTSLLACGRSKRPHFFVAGNMPVSPAPCHMFDDITSVAIIDVLQGTFQFFGVLVCIILRIVGFSDFASQPRLLVVKLCAQVLVILHLTSEYTPLALNFADGVFHCLLAYLSSCLSVHKMCLPKNCNFSRKKDAQCIFLSLKLSIIQYR